MVSLNTSDANRGDKAGVDIDNNCNANIVNIKEKVNIEIKFELITLLI